MADGDSGGETSDIQLVWGDRDDAPILFSNLILAQNLRDDFIISFGQASPPILPEDEGKRREALEGIDFVPVKTIARIGMSAQRMREFVAVMQQNLERYEQEMGESK